MNFHRNLDEISYKLKKLIVNIIESRKNNIEIVESNLKALNPRRLLKLYKLQLESYSDNLHNSHNSVIESKRNELKILESKIIALNPEAILERGYSIVIKKNKIITNSSDLKKGEDINIVLYKGNIDAKVKKTNQ